MNAYAFKDEWSASFRVTDPFKGKNSSRLARACYMVAFERNPDFLTPERYQQLKDAAQPEVQFRHAQDTIAQTRASKFSSDFWDQVDQDLAAYAKLLAQQEAPAGASAARHEPPPPLGLYVPVTRKVSSRTRKIRANSLNIARLK